MQTCKRFTLVLILAFFAGFFVQSMAADKILKVLTIGNSFSEDENQPETLFFLLIIALKKRQLIFFYFFVENITHKYGKKMYLCPQLSSVKLP